MDLSTTVRNSLADSFGGLFASGFLEIRTGSSPGADNAATGTLLASVALPASPFTAAASDQITKNGTWSDSSAASTGTAGHARLKSADGTMVVDLTVTATGGGGELQLDSTSIVATGPVTITAVTITKTGS